MARTRENATPTLPDDLVLPERIEEEFDEPDALGAKVDDDRPTRAPTPGKRPIVRDLDAGSDERLARLRRKRALELEALRDNPFLEDEQPGLPKLPDDDPAWSYKWVRHSLPAASATENRQVDTANLQNTVQGRLPYEFVRKTDLAPKWQAYLASFAVMEGQHAGYLVYRDLIAARTEKRLRDMKVAANEYRAKQQRDDLRSGIAEQMYRSGMRPWSEDRELVEGRDVPYDWEV
jgi:hypothetical protein